MKDERECPHCKQIINCSKAGYRTLNAHKTICDLNPKALERKEKLDTYRKEISPRRSQLRVLECSQCKDQFDIYLTDEQLKKGKHRKHCSRQCSNITTNSKGRDKKIASLKLTCSKGLVRKRANPWPKGDTYRRTEKRMDGIKKRTQKRVPVNCFCCKKEILVKEKYSDKVKFCNGTCRNKVNNKIIRGTRSKGEIKLEKEIRVQFPELLILPNDRKILGGLELDIYIPELKLGIEWNGIWHRVDVRKNGNLKRTQVVDKEKIKRASELGIELFIVEDITSLKKEVNSHIHSVIEKIKLLSK